MNKKDTKLPSLCGSSSLERPRFSPGLLLEDEDLNAMVTYTRDLTRMMFRSLFGCGVICGLKVSAKPICAGRKWEITVSKGLAMDCMGDFIEVPSDVKIEYDPGCDNFVVPLWITVCYSEKCCRPKDATCSQGETQPQQTRVRAGYEVKLYGALPSCACHCATADDNTPPAKPRGCCGETQPAPTASTAAAAAPPPASPAVSGAPATAAAPNPPTICACYRPHFDGECECGCCCSCVVIGKITGIPTVDKDQHPILLDKQVANVDYTMVRRIRPILNGYADCGTLQLGIPPKPTQPNPNAPSIGASAGGGGAALAHAGGPTVHAGPQVAEAHVGPEVAEVAEAPAEGGGGGGVA